MKSIDFAVRLLAKALQSPLNIYQFTALFSVAAGLHTKLDIEQVLALPSVSNGVSRAINVLTEKGYLTCTTDPLSEINEYSLSEKGKQVVKDSLSFLNKL